MNKNRLWTMDFVTISTINFLLYMVFLLLIVTMAPYAIDKYHVSTSVAGLAAGIFIIGALCGRLVTGRIIEDMSSKRILIVSAILSIITSTLYFGAINIELLLINRLLHGIVFGMASTTTGTIVAKIIPHNRRGEGISYYSMSAILGTALGPVIGFFLIQNKNYNMIFIVTFVLAIIVFVVSFVVSEPVHKAFTRVQEYPSNSFAISNFLEFKAIPIAVVTLVLGFCNSGVMAFMSLYSKQIHLLEAASFYFFVNAIVVILSRPFCGRLFDIKGANLVMYPCILIFAIGMLLLSQASNGIALLLSGAIVGLGYGNYLSCAQAISIKVSPPHRLGRATATYFMFLDLGFGSGPYLLGCIIPFTGYRGLYLMLTFVILADIVFYYFLHGRKESYALVAHRQ